MTAAHHLQEHIDYEALPVARVYASALWNLAQQHNQTGEILEEIRSLIDDVIKQQPLLRSYFELPSISEDKHAELIDKLFAGQASDLLVNFLQTLNRHHRLELLPAIREVLEEKWRKLHERVAVVVRSAVPLGDEQIEQIRGVLAGRLGIQPEFDFQVEPAILGGLWVRVGDMVYDYTVRSNLKQLRDNILTRSFHEVQSRRNLVDRPAGN